ncbi:hypothetical protein PFMG_02067 [Plasmodium falciparum IGH-CR14]|uniref:GPI inositol-deacylase n=1 Tax=Plasmodium falciparum IGH-CR14 TaxID=580059 RepID=A0A0L1I8Y6_PLAFA|nr:hypothetical protein PFMG_02067 [Plasmodium falciparum IGH-CR14]
MYLNLNFVKSKNSFNLLSNNDVHGLLLILGQEFLKCNTDTLDKEVIKEQKDNLYNNYNIFLHDENNDYNENEEENYKRKLEKLNLLLNERNMKILKISCFLLRYISIDNRQSKMVDDIFMFFFLMKLNFVMNMKKDIQRKHIEKDFNFNFYFYILLLYYYIYIYNTTRKIKIFDQGLIHHYEYKPLNEFNTIYKNYENLKKNQFFNLNRYGIYNRKDEELEYYNILNNNNNYNIQYNNNNNNYNNRNMFYQYNYVNDKKCIFFLKRNYFINSKFLKNNFPIYFQFNDLSNINFLTNYNNFKILRKKFYENTYKYKSDIINESLKSYVLFTLNLLFKLNNVDKTNEDMLISNVKKVDKQNSKNNLTLINSFLSAASVGKRWMLMFWFIPFSKKKENKTNNNRNDNNNDNINNSNSVERVGKVSKNILLKNLNEKKKNCKNKIMLCELIYQSLDYITLNEQVQYNNKGYNIIESCLTEIINHIERKYKLKYVSSTKDSNVVLDNENKKKNKNEKNTSENDENILFNIINIDNKLKNPKNIVNVEHLLKKLNELLKLTQNSSVYVNTGLHIILRNMFINRLNSLNLDLLFLINMYSNNNYKKKFFHYDQRYIISNNDSEKNESKNNKEMDLKELNKKQKDTHNDFLSNDINTNENIMKQYDNENITTPDSNNNNNNINGIKTLNISSLNVSPNNKTEEDHFNLEVTKKTQGFRKRLNDNIYNELSIILRIYANCLTSKDICFDSFSLLYLQNSFFFNDNMNLNSFSNALRTWRFSNLYHNGSDYHFYYKNKNLEKFKKKDSDLLKYNTNEKSVNNNNNNNNKNKNNVSNNKNKNNVSNNKNKNNVSNNKNKNNVSNNKNKNNVNNNNNKNNVNNNNNNNMNNIFNNNKWNFLEMTNLNNKFFTNEKNNTLKENNKDLSNNTNTINVKFNSMEKLEEKDNVIIYDDFRKKVRRLMKIKNNFQFIFNNHLINILMLNYKHNQNIVPMYTKTNVINKNLFKSLFLQNKKLKHDLDIYSDELSYLIWPFYLLYPIKRNANIYVFNYHSPLYPDGNFYTKVYYKNDNKNSTKLYTKHNDRRNKNKKVEHIKKQEDISLKNNSITNVNVEKEKNADNMYNYYMNVVNSFFNTKKDDNNNNNNILEYNAHKEKYFYTDRMNFDEMSSFLLKKLKNTNIGKKNDIMFVAHSMGGLLTQYILLKNDHFLNKTKCIFFYATPHFGSPLSSSAYLLKPFLSPYVYQLNDYDSKLNYLQQSFKERIKNKDLVIYSFSESEKSPLPFIGVYTMIVPCTSAYLYYSKIFTIIKYCNHLEISKLNSEEDVKFYYLNKVMKEFSKIK